MGMKESTKQEGVQPVALVIASLALGSVVGWFARDVAAALPIRLVEALFWALIALTVAGALACIPLLAPGTQPWKWRTARFGLIAMLVGVIPLALIGMVQL